MRHRCKAHASGGFCTGTVTVDVLYWRNIAGQTIAETDSAGSTSNAYYHEYVFFAGRLVARSDPSSGSVYYFFVDQVGSTRIVTDDEGAVCFEQDYYPYGQEVYTGAQSCPQSYKFTGYERDWETGLDYAFARYYNPRLGRFMSADPLAGSVGDPQSLNLYAYVQNNPANLVDPSGLCPEGPGVDGCWDFDIVFTFSWGSGRDDERPRHRSPHRLPRHSSATQRTGPGNSILPGETAGVPDWLRRNSDLSRWVIVNFSYVGPVINLTPINWHKIKIWVLGLKKWPSYGSNSCGVYDSSGREGLGDICRFFGDSKISDSIRGCIAPH